MADKHCEERCPCTKSGKAADTALSSTWIPSLIVISLIQMPNQLIFCVLHRLSPTARLACQRLLLAFSPFPRAFATTTDRSLAPGRSEDWQRDQALANLADALLTRFRLQPTQFLLIWKSGPGELRLLFFGHSACQPCPTSGRGSRCVFFEPDVLSDPHCLSRISLFHHSLALACPTHHFGLHHVHRLRSWHVIARVIEAIGGVPTFGLVFLRSLRNLI